MEATKNLLKQLITEESMNMSFNELISRYQYDLNPSMLATVYLKLYDLIQKVSMQYPGLTQQDIASYSLEKLDMCLQTYQPGKTKFITYYVTVLKRCFMKETWAQKMLKRKSMLYAESLEQMHEEGWDIETPAIEFSDEFSYISSLKLSPRQENYLILTMQGFSVPAIAKMLGVSHTTVYNYKKALRKKILLTPL